MSVTAVAIAACDRADRAWAEPLIRALEQMEQHRGLLWVMQCIRDLLSMTGSTKLSELTADVDRLYEYLKSQPSNLELSEAAREIWYRPDRDDEQTAVAKLYEAFAAGSSAPDTRYERALAAPINLLVFNGMPPAWNSRSIPRFAVVMHDFQRFSTTSGTPDAESGRGGHF